MCEEGTFEPRPEGGQIQLRGIWRKDAPAQTKAGGLRHAASSPVDSCPPAGLSEEVHLPRAHGNHHLVLLEMYPTTAQ